MSIEMPSPAIIKTETIRNEPAGIPLNCTMVERKRVKNVKLAINPTTTPIGRNTSFSLSPIDDERTMGKIGRIHGDKIVTSPAKNANPRSKIIEECKC
jgi:hypothetical protein